MTPKFATVDKYLLSFSPEIRERLSKVRELILTNAPEAQELISYNMPAYKLHGRVLVYFAGYAKHVGFYATPTGHQKFEKQLSKYKQGKGSVQFPHTEPLPQKLIAEMVRFRAEENSKLK